MSEIAQWRTHALRAAAVLLLGVTVARTVSSGSGAWTRFGTIDLVVATSALIAVAATLTVHDRAGTPHWPVARRLAPKLAALALTLTLVRLLLAGLGVGVPVGIVPGQPGWAIVASAFALAALLALSRPPAAMGRLRVTSRARAWLPEDYGKVALAAVGALFAAGMFVSVYRLGRPSWILDELFYRAAGYAYVAHGDFSLNREHVFLAKDLIGAAQLLFGSGPTAVRLPSALAGLLTGVALAQIARGVSGLLAAGAAFAAWTLLPHPIHLDSGNVAVVSLERYGLLDPLMVLFLVVALGCGWRWIETGSWRWALALGAAGGAAVASKVTAACMLPALIVCGVLMAGDRRAAVRQAALVAVAFAAVLLVSYLPPLGDSPTSLGDMLHLQHVHSAFGHPVVIDGHVYARAPWWAHLWWVWHSLGPVPTVALLGCAVVAPVAIGWRLGTYLWVAVLVPFAYLSLFVGFGLPHYYIVWIAPLTLLGALGFASLWRMGPPARGRAAAAAARGGAAAVAAAVGVVMVGTVRDVATLEGNDYAPAGRLLTRDGLARANVGVWYAQGLLSHYLPTATMTLAPPPGVRLDAIVVDPNYAATIANRPLGAYLFLTRRRFAACRVDRLIVYIRLALPAAGRRGGLC